MKTDAIVHLFDWPFARCEAELPALAALGFGAIQISPPQLSIDEPAWWGRYQPLDFRRIEGPLGDEAGLRRLADAAHRHGLKLLVDVVLNHMAGGVAAQGLRYAHFGPEHFHPAVDIDYRELRSIREGWLVGLPDLCTEHPHVRAEGRRYLELLLACGADGFRFDAVKHMEPEYFAAVLDGLSADGYGEYILQPGHEPVMRDFLPQMDLLDFSLYQSLARALEPGGDWASLDRVHEEADAALPPGRGVAFVTNHDLELEQYGGFCLPADGLALAHAFTVCRLQSRPLVWMDHRSEPVLRAALRLRARAAAGGGWQTLQASRQLLVWRSLDGGALLVFNGASAPRHLDSAWLAGPGTGWRDAVENIALPPSAVLGPRLPGLYLRG